MPNPRNPKPGRPHLKRDGQQWIFDYIIQQSHREYHWWSGGKPRLPESVRTHAMIPKHFGMQAQQLEIKGLTAITSGDRDAALDLFFAAALTYMKAQHPIFENNDEKLFLYSGLRRCYDQVCALSPYRIERIEIPWEGKSITGYLHLLNGTSKAPLLINIPGCDLTCENWPNPRSNPGHARGMHVFSFDGPGTGQANISGVRLTADNYEIAASAMLDHLVTRPEIDPEQIVITGGGMGSFWALRIAGRDDRIKAAATRSTYADKYYLMNEDGPRWKQLFGYLTNSDTEEQLDALLEDMTLHGYMEQIKCPTLMISGEYDHRDPIEEVLGLFDQLQAPAEMWLFADQFIEISLADGQSVVELLLDWLRDRLEGVPLKYPGEVLYIEPGDEGPTSPTVKLKRRWFEESH